MVDKNITPPPTKKVNINDVAREANVSIATVSRYFNDGYVSVPNKEKIAIAIEKLNYTMNLSAKSMRKTDNVIFIVSPSITKPKTQWVIEQITNNSDENTFVFCCQGNYDVNYFINTLKNIIARNPAVIIIFLPFYAKEIVEYINSITELNLIIVSQIDNSFNKNHIVVKVDDYQGYYECTKLILTNEKYNNLVYVGRSPNEHYLDMVIYQKRLDGFIDATKMFNKNNIKIDTAHLSHNTIADATDTLTKLYRLGYRNFVCGSHTIFRAGINNKLFNDCTFTDYGDTHLSDVANRYKYKIRINNESITNKIFEIINEIESKNITNNKYIITPNIEIK